MASSITQGKGHSHSPDIHLDLPCPYALPEETSRKAADSLCRIPLARTTGLSSYPGQVDWQNAVAVIAVPPDVSPL